MMRCFASGRSSVVTESRGDLQETLEPLLPWRSSRRSSTRHHHRHIRNIMRHSSTILLQCVVLPHPQPTTIGILLRMVLPMECATDRMVPQAIQALPQMGTHGPPLVTLTRPTLRRMATIPMQRSALSLSRPTTHRSRVHIQQRRSIQEATILKHRRSTSIGIPMPVGLETHTRRRNILPLIIRLVLSIITGILCHTRMRMLPDRATMHRDCRVLHPLDMGLHLMAGGDDCVSLALYQMPISCIILLKNSAQLIA